MRKSSIRTFLIFVCLFSINTEKRQIFSQGNDVQTILNSIRIDSITKFVNELTGETPASINGENIFINSRNYSDLGNEYAEKYITQKLKDYKLKVNLQDFGSGGRNIIGVKTGTKYPTRKFIFCAHFDSHSSNPSFAPGADDNASGSAVVIEAARLLSEYNTDYTLVFALWDEEELGLKGSNYYAQNAKNNNDTIMGVMNLDMIGYDALNDHKLLLSTQQNSLSFLMTNKLVSINSSYDIGLHLIFNYSSQLASDHLSFMNAGYPAVLLIEDEKGGDFNLYYHTQDDKITAFNINYYEKCAKLSIASIAALSGVYKTIVSSQKIITLPEKTNLGIYPNPFNSTANIKISLPKSSNVSIKIFDEMGRDIKVLFSGFLLSGVHEFTWEAKNIPSGIYYISMHALWGTTISRAVYLK